MNVAAAIALLQLALSLLSAVQGATGIPQSLIDTASKTASQAIAQAQLVLNAQGALGENSTPVAVISNPTSVQPDTSSSASGAGALGPNATGPYTPITLGSSYDYSGSDVASQLLRALSPSGTPLPSVPVTTPGQPITVTDQAPSNATCVSGSSTYQSGATVGCPDKPASGLICALGPVYTKWKCSGGAWVEIGTEDSMGTPPSVTPNDTACSFSNTPVGTQCGGYYHCGFGVAGDYWSATLTSACTMAR